MFPFAHCHLMVLTDVVCVFQCFLFTILFWRFLSKVICVSIRTRLYINKLVYVCMCAEILLYACTRSGFGCGATAWHPQHSRRIWLWNSPALHGMSCKYICVCLSVCVFVSICTCLPWFCFRSTYVFLWCLAFKPNEVAYLYVWQLAVDTFVYAYYTNIHTCSNILYMLFVSLAAN